MKKLLRITRLAACSPELPAILLICLVCALPLAGQDFRARLSVTVTDPTGAAIPGAELRLRSVATSDTLNAATNESGNYTFLFLQPGAYTLDVSSAGFKPVRRDSIVLQTYQASGIAITLDIGDVTDSVTVTGEAALLQTESASRGMVVDNKLVNDLPVTNRNPLMLGQILPGVYMRPLGIYTHPWTITSQFMINGGLMYLNDFQVDGAPNNAQFANNVYGYSPPNEAVQEMTVQANSYDAQYGRTGGGVINITTKAGTNEFHGIAWTYLQRPGWNANSFQNNAIGAPRTPQRQNQWGLQLSGPVKIPKLIPGNERFRMFGLFSFDKYRTELPNVLNLSVPEPEMRTGDFSRLTNAAGQLITIYDPMSGRTVAGSFVRDAFPGNRIPADRIDPVARAVAGYFPAPNSATSGVRYSSQNLKLPNNRHYWDFYNWLARADFQIGDKHRVFVRPARMLFDELANYNGIEGAGRQGGVFSRSNHAILADWVGTLNPTLIANLRVSATRFGEGWNSPENLGFDLTKLGLSQSFVNQLAQPALFGRWEWSGYINMGQAVNWNNTNTYSLAGSINKFIGSHNIRAGVDYRLTDYLSYATGNPFLFQSTAAYTRRIWNQAASETDSGDSFASFLLGAPASGNATYNVAPFFRSPYFAPWFQDDWKVTRRLTLNFGVRWDLNVAPIEKHDRMNVGFDTTAPNPVSRQIPAAALQQYPHYANLTGGLTFAGVGGAPRRPTNTVFNNIQPRAGMAYQVNPKLVFRGGYGLYYTNFQSNGMMQTVGFSNTTNMVASLDEGRTPIRGILSNPYPSGIEQPIGASQGLLTYVGRNFSHWNRDYRLPHVHQFSAGFQYQVARNSVFDISYVGSRTLNTSGNLNTNLQSWDFIKQCDVVQGGRRGFCDQLVPNPFVGVEAFRGTTLFSAPTTSLANVNRPYPHFDGTLTMSGDNQGKLWYNALQVIFTQRFTHGLTMNVNYTRSRQIEQWGWMDEYRRIPQRSPYFSDHPHVFKLSASYDIPVGRGRTFLNSANWFVDTLLGGWQIAPSTFIQNGERANLPANALRLRDSRVGSVDWNQNQPRGWNACVLNVDNNGVVSPMPYSVQRYGCSATDFSQYDWVIYPVLTGQRLSPSGAGDLRMMPYIDSNIALGKTFRVREKVNLRFRMEVANALNRFNYLTAKFNTTPTDPNFGTIFPALTSGLDAPPRVVTLGLRASW